MLHRDHRADVFARIPLFASCSKRDLRKIASIADELDLKSGKVLTRQGGPGREFFVLVEGSAEIERDGKCIETLGPGEFFGELALLCERPRTATITAVSPVRVLVLTATNFKRLLRENPSISVKVLEAVAARTPPSASD